MRMWIGIVGLTLACTVLPERVTAQLLSPSYSFPVPTTETVGKMPSLLQASPIDVAVLPRIGSPWSYNALGIFCKMDVQFERHLKIPVFFRLGGDVQTVDAWEGKGSLRKR